jgi:hypothetical protein
MWKWINDTLCEFRHCFSREASFKWFTIAVLGFIIGQEHMGITSFIRELWIAPIHYEAMLNFFRSKAWTVTSLQSKWIHIVQSSNLLFKESSMPILAADGVKQIKESKKMPCVKKMHQDSGNSSQPIYTFGHMFGAVGVLIGNTEKLYCLPLSIKFHDGDEQIQQWLDPDTESESHVIRIIRDASKVAKELGHSILVADRYYLSVQALRTLAEEELKAGKPLLLIVTRAKFNVCAYEKPIRKPGRGRPPVKGNKVKLSELFTSCANQFTKTTVVMYGKKQTVSYLCKDLLWGQKLYRKLRFVLVKRGNTTSILVSTNTDLSPEQIISLYSYRFKIECCFRELKQVIAGFAYRFWSKAMPKLNRFAKSSDTDPLDAVTDEKQKKHIIATFDAIQKFVMVACIATGILQLCSLLFCQELNSSPLRWLRTRSNYFPSEATTADFLRKSFFSMVWKKLDLTVMRYIREAQFEHDGSSDEHLST